MLYRIKSLSIFVALCEAATYEPNRAARQSGLSRRAIVQGELAVPISLPLPNFFHLHLSSTTRCKTHGRAHGEERLPEVDMLQANMEGLPLISEHFSTS